MDNLITQESALSEIIDAVVGNQTEFTNNGVKALVKTVFQIYNHEYLKKEEVVLTPDEELLNQFGIEIISTKFSRVQIDEAQLDFLFEYIPKIPEGQFARVKNPKGIYKLKEELIKRLGTEFYKFTISYSGGKDNKTKILSIYKSKKNIA